MWYLLSISILSLAGVSMASVGGAWMHAGDANGYVLTLAGLALVFLGNVVSCGSLK